LAIRSARRWIKRERDVDISNGTTLPPVVFRHLFSHLVKIYLMGNGQPYSCTLVHISIRNLSPLVCAEQKRRVDNYLCVTGASYRDDNDDLLNGMVGGEELGECE
jgi:hypothetical protein